MCGNVVKMHKKRLARLGKYTTQRRLIKNMQKNMKKYLTKANVCGILIKLSARTSNRTLKIEQRKTRKEK